MKTKTIRILQGLGIVLLAVGLGVLALRPFYLSWGATAKDQGRAMPGDLSGTRWTRAIVIGACITINRPSNAARPPPSWPS